MNIIKFPKFLLHKLVSRPFALKSTKPNKSLNKNTQNTSNELNEERKYIKKEQIININPTQPTPEIPIPEDPMKKREEETYACVYYKYFMNSDFDLYKLRNILYSYLFVRQRKGNFYLNVCDANFPSVSIYYI